MGTYLLRRLVWTIPTAFLVVVGVFLILFLAPGDPARLVAGEDADLRTVELVRHDLGLDRPPHEQLVRYLGGVARLDLGRSIHSKTPVAGELAARLPATVQLSVVALVIAVVVGTVLGVFAAVRQGTVWDLGSSLLATVLVSAPAFWVGLLLILVFAVLLGWLPAAGREEPLSVVLPALALAGYPLALIARIVRSECLEVLGQEYIRTARAKGLPNRLVLYRHALRNALLPVITVVGLQFGAALGGAVVVESVFGWPGVGRYVVDAIFRRDFPVVQGTLLVVGLGFLAINLVVDLLYAYVDPRIRYQ